MSEEAKWYVAHTYSGYENKVASNLEKVVESRNLQDYIEEIVVPTEKVIEVREDGKTKEVERKIYPGYVMIKMIVTDESWYAVRNIRGCTGFVGTTTDPIPLSDEEVERLGVGKRADDVEMGTEKESNGQETETTIVLPYEVGDSVKITEGSLEGYVGIVTEIDFKSSTVRVLVSMFGRETPADLPITQVQVMN